jgi:hypothetical protein
MFTLKLVQFWVRTESESPKMSFNIETIRIGFVVKVQSLQTVNCVNFFKTQVTGNMVRFQFWSDLAALAE